MQGRISYIDRSRYADTKKASFSVRLKTDAKVKATGKKRKQQKDPRKFGFNLYFTYSAFS